MTDLEKEKLQGILINLEHYKVELYGIKVIATNTIWGMQDEIVSMIRALQELLKEP